MRTSSLSRSDPNPAPSSPAALVFNQLLDRTLQAMAALPANVQREVGLSLLEKLLWVVLGEAAGKRPPRCVLRCVPMEGDIEDKLLVDAMAEGLVGLDRREFANMRLQLIARKPDEAIYLMDGDNGLANLVFESDERVPARLRLPENNLSQVDSKHFGTRTDLYPSEFQPHHSTGKTCDSRQLMELGREAGLELQTSDSETDDLDSPLILHARGPAAVTK